MFLCAGFAVKGEDVLIEMEMRVQLTVNCAFDLVLFPFGSQTCSFYIHLNRYQPKMQLEFVSLRDYPGLSFEKISDGRIKGEYKLQNITDWPVESRPESIEVRIELKSQYGYYIISNYVPSLLMFLVAYSSFFFPIDNFSERVMVSLTSLLVLAAFFTQASDTTVHTPYVKMLDAWFTCLIVVNFSVVILNVIINNIATNETSESNVVYVKGFNVTPGNKRSKRNPSIQKAIIFNFWVKSITFAVMIAFLVVYILLALEVILVK